MSFSELCITGWHVNKDLPTYLPTYLYHWFISYILRSSSHSKCMLLLSKWRLIFTILVMFEMYFQYNRLAKTSCVIYTAVNANSLSCLVHIWSGKFKNSLVKSMFSRSTWGPPFCFSRETRKIQNGGKVVQEMVGKCCVRWPFLSLFHHILVWICQKQLPPMYSFK